MSRLIVLGSTGMLGAEVVRVAQENSVSFVEISRSSNFKFDACIQPFDEIACRVSLNSEDYLVNCIGWIPQKATGVETIDSEIAYRLNSALLEEISIAQENIGFSWIQIGTDCVYDGKSGHYSESSPKTAHDLYGMSKISGEQYTQGSILIRSSIVGPDVRSNAGLYAWFKSIPFGSKVVGFDNVLWNGVSTFAFAKLIIGIMRTNGLNPSVNHWIPADFVTKFQLLGDFREYLGRFDLNLVRGAQEITSNRVLVTDHPEVNDFLWKLAGYSTVPTISELVKEFIERDIEGIQS